MYSYSYPLIQLISNLQKSLNDFSIDLILNLTSFHFIWLVILHQNRISFTIFFSHERIRSSIFALSKVTKEKDAVIDKNSMTG